MSFIFNTTLDEELDRYANAENAIAANLGSNLNDTKKQYNVATNKNEFFKNNQGGGYVKVFEQELTALEDAQMYNQSLLDKGFTPTRDDFYAAGFDDAIINEGGFINAQAKSGRTEPLTEDEQNLATDMGFSVASAVDQPIFEGSIKEIIKGLARGGITNPAQFLENLDTPEDSKFDLSGGIGFQIFNPETGEFDPAIKILSGNERNEINQKIKSGELPYAINLESLTQIDEASGGGAKVVGSLAQFAGAYAGLGKFFRLGKSRTMQGFTGGAAADFLGFEGDEGRLSDIIYDLGEAFGVEIPQNVIVDFMQTDPTDPDYVGRFKNALEGGVIGVLAEPILLGIGKTFRMLKDGDITQEQVLPFVKAATNNMQETFTNVVKDVGERLNQPGQMPPLGSNLGNVDALRREANIQRFGYNPNDPVAKVEAPTENKPGIIAFHGSGADFNEFKLEKIGTGEGAQMFGYGLYFADKEDIAKFYKDTLTEVPFDYKIDGQSVGQMYNNAIKTENYELAEVLEQVQLHDSPDELKERFTIENGYSEKTQNFVRDLNYDNLTGVNSNGEKISLGRMYKVGLTPKPEDLLDYDKPLSKQSKKIQERTISVLKKNSSYPGSNKAALEMTGAEIETTLAYNIAEKVAKPRDIKLEQINSQLQILAKEIDKYSTGYRQFTDPKGKVAANKYDALLEEREKLPKYIEKRDARRMASEELNKGGIPGIKYLDNASRNSKGNTKNYVIFDEKLINIMKKYGIAAPVAVSSMAVKSSDQEDET